MPVRACARGCWSTSRILSGNTSRSSCARICSCVNPPPLRRVHFFDNHFAGWHRFAAAHLRSLMRFFIVGILALLGMARFAAAAEEPSMPAEPVTIESDCLKLTISPVGGKIVGLYNKVQ